MRNAAIWLFYFLLLPYPQVHAQQYAFAVSFTNKNGTLGTLANPSTYLSQRAINRRTAQNIAIDSTDLPVSKIYIDSILQLTGGIYHNQSKWLNWCVVLLHDSSQILNLQNKNFISDIKYIAYYSTYLHHKAAPIKGFTNTNSSPNYQITQKTTGSAAYYGATYSETIFVNGDCLHDMGYKGQGKLIAVLDAGFLGTDNHPGFDSLYQTGRVLETYNFALDTTYVYSYDSHGTSCLSTMAGNNPGVFVGSAPYASYALYVTEDVPEQPIKMYNLVAGTERADSLGADVISCSLGYDIFDPPWPTGYFSYNPNFDGKSTVPCKGVNAATSKGILFVTSAGNDGASSWYYILTPGDADSALTIGATDLSKIPYAATGHGPNFAGQIKPDVCANGVSANVFYQGGIYSSGTGTSFATPQIAGWAACLWQYAGNVSPYRIRAAIDSSADHHANPDSQVGYGIPNFCSAIQLLNVKDTPKNPLGNDWIKAGPNPFTGNTLLLHAYLKLEEDIQVSLYDAAGKTIMQQTIHLYSGYNSPISLNLPNALAVGMYLLKATSAEGSAFIKLAKI
jgi:serine protease AprX